VAVHRPVLGAVAARGEDPARVEAYASRMRAALTAAGVPVHVVLSGHAHSLQLLLGSRPEPPLHAVAGSASDTGVLRRDEPARAASALAAGFGRLDVVEEGAATRLVVTLYRLLPAPLDRVSSRRLGVARYAVDRAGNAVAE
jgi:hypothetical protein